MTNMEEDLTGVKHIKVEYDLPMSMNDSETNRFESEPHQAPRPLDYEHISKQPISSSDHTSPKTTVDTIVCIKQEEGDDSNEAQECEYARDAVEEVSKKKRRLNPVFPVCGKEGKPKTTPMDPNDTAGTTGMDNPQSEAAASIAAKDGCDDSESCHSSEDLPEHLSDFATPLMEIEVFETNEEERAKNGSRRTRNRSKFIRGRASKGMGKGCENCRSKCHLRITENQRRSIFEHFWCLEDPARQWLFIDLHTKTKETERKTTNWQSNRKISRTYYFDINGAEVKVCQVMFLSTLGVSEKWVRNLAHVLKGDPGTFGIDPSDVALPSGIDWFNESLDTSQNFQDHVESSVASEEESTSTLNEPFGENSDSCDSDETLRECQSDIATPLVEIEEVDTANTSESPSAKSREKSKSRGKWNRGKVMGKGCENCRAKCQLKITDAQRSAFFEHFWSLGDAAKQWQFIAKHARAKETERKTTNWHSNRKVTRSYFFDVGDDQVKVCQLMFLSTLGISEKWIKTALTKKDQDLFPDRRGKTRKPFCKLKGPVFDSIVEHVNSLERCEECREILGKECLPESLSLKKMYYLYGLFMKEKQEKVDEEAKPKQKKVVLAVATERQYRDIFKKEFSLSFHPPRKGQCERCLAKPTVAAAPDGKGDRQLEEHVRSKDTVREIKDSDKVEAVKHTCICLASFDTQRIGLPCGDVPAFYYAKRLNAYHLSVFDIGKSQPYGYVWHEQTAKRGSNESASCLKDFVEQRVTSGISDFRFYSDSCTLLKKSKYIFGLWYYLSQKHSLSVTHRFLESGHTLTEGHAILTDIERRVRKQCLYSLQEVMRLIKDIRESKPSVVKELEQRDVYDMEDLLSGQNWDRDVSGNEVRWGDVREVQVSGSSPGIVKFKYDFLSEYLVLQVEGPECRVEYAFKRAYQQKLPLSKVKKDSLISLCTKNLIPGNQQEFYYRLSAVSEDA